MNSLFQSVAYSQTLYSAWLRVRANAGAPGVDKVSIQDFEDALEKNLGSIKDSLLDDSYQPQSLRTFTLKKETGGERILHIPTIRDRIVAQAVVQVLQPDYEKIFHNSSYAYRPGRSAQKAIIRVERNLERGRIWALNLDIENFFDAVNRNLLIEMMTERVDDTRLLKLVRLLLDAFENDTGLGIAQGLPISPFLSNIYLHPLDDRLIRAQWNYIRYSDNILVLDKTEKNVQTAQAWIQEEFVKLELKVRADKTEIVNLSTGFTFLGFHFDEKGKKPAQAAFKRLNRRVGGLLSKAFEYSDSQMQEKLGAMLRGWLNYFQIKEPDNNKLFNTIDDVITDEKHRTAKTIMKSLIAYQLGDLTAARELIQQQTESPVDSEQCFQMGVLSEVLGLQNEALDYFLTALREQPDHVETAFQVGLYYLHRQRHEQALRYLQKAVQGNPDSALYQFTLGTALKNYSLHGAARKVLQKAYALDPALKRVAARSPRYKTINELYRTFTDHDLTSFLRIFDGKEGVHARQWMNDDGKTGYSTLKRPMREDDVKNHLLGKITLGSYIMRSDNTVNYLVFDLDVTKQVRNEILTSSDELEQWRDFVWTDAHLILTTLRHKGLTAYAEDSGFKGMHVWLFFAEPQPAKRVIAFAQKLLAEVGTPPPGIHREIFPKQAWINRNALGSLIKLPMGIHKATSRRCEFLTSHGDPVEMPLHFMRHIVHVSAKDFQSVITQMNAAQELDPNKVDKADEDKIDTIFENCNILKHLAQKAEKEEHLSHTDRLTLLGVLGHVGETGRQKLHSIIGKTLNYDFHITDKWVHRQKGFPVSCPKIRLWHSHITSAVVCDCSFKDQPGNYPSPLLHADPTWVAKIKKQISDNENAPDRKTGVAHKKEKSPCQKKTMNAGQQSQKKLQPSDSPDLNTLVELYLMYKKQKHDAEKNLVDIERQMQAIAHDDNIECFHTSYGRLKKVNTNGVVSWALELEL